MQSTLKCARGKVFVISSSISSTKVNIDELAFLTDTPGIGGSIKQRSHDFFVEEIPLYEPSGEGEHLYLFVEKLNMTTMDAARRIAKAFNTRSGNVGIAGMKDKQAVTRQHFSVYLPSKAADEKGLANLADSPVKVLWSDRHGNKLRRGHLKANRFTIRVRDVSVNTVINAKATLNKLIQTGIPNYLGEQRFGYMQNNATLGRMLLTDQFKELLDLMLGGAEQVEHERTQEGRAAYDQGDYDAALEAWPKRMRHERQALAALAKGVTPKSAVRSMDSYHREFLVNALQSAIFNYVLDQRIRNGLFDKLVEGDLAWKHDSRSVFAVDTQTAEIENKPDGRAADKQVSPSGPMWGVEMTRAAGQVDQWELNALQQFGLELSHLEVARKLHAAGARRPMRIEIFDPQVSAGGDEHGPYVQLSFELERGAFATVVLREVMKHDVSE